MLQTLRLFIFGLLLTPLAAFAQHGTIKGTVKDATTGEGVIGANVAIKGTTQGASVDIEGNFEISRVSAGTYTLVISFISYKTDTIKNVTVYPDQATVINTLLAEESTSLNEVVVTGQRAKNTDISVISEIKMGQLVVSGISAQQISLSQDRDAAQVVRRVPGITISDGKFVNVRGLTQRYNTVLLNGIIAPSSEVDTKAFAFDLIPSSMIDRMMVYKSGSPEFSGEFAGAVIDIDTKSVVLDNSLSVNFTAGFRNGTTFQNFNTHNGSNTDWLGFDNGYRALPSDFPKQNIGYISDGSQEREDVSKMLRNDWSTKKITAAPDLRTTINFSRAGRLFGKKFSNLTSLAYTSTKQGFSQAVNFYANGTRNYNDEVFQVNSRSAVISNFILELNTNNKIEFRNLFNQMGTIETTQRTGTDVPSEQYVNDLALNYYSKRVYAGQLNGKHTLSDRTNVSWNLAFSNVHGNQPDYRNISARKGFNDNVYSIQIPSSSSIQDGGRFFSTLNENSYTQSTNVEFKLNPSVTDANRVKKITTGYYVSYANREFNARWFAYSYATSSVEASDVTSGASFTDIFKKENIGYPSTPSGPPYFILNEGTSLSDQYKGKNLLTAGYANLYLPLFEKWNTSGGVRTEFNQQQLIYRDAFKGGQFSTISNPVLRVLPFVNIAYNYSEKSKIRLAYSKTVNRPVFRELAPFNFYDFNRKANFSGNTKLKTADINNVDLRWENYPSTNESVSFAIFYKSFQNAIEQVLVPGSNLWYTWANADKASSYGIEVEARESFSRIFGSNSLTEKFSFMLNAALIKSQAHYNFDINNPISSNQMSKRPLQGQSPYIVNTGIYYNDIERGWQANLSYNVYGKRIYAVGDRDQNPNQYEMPRNQVDLTVSKMIAQRFEIKFGVQDIFNQKYRLIQDTNYDGKIDKRDDYMRSYRLGQYVTFGLTYNIN